MDVLFMPSRGIRAEDLIYRELIENPGSVFYQNELCRKLGVNSKTVSKVLRKFEERGIIKREKAYRSGKITYRIIVLKKEIEQGNSLSTTTTKTSLDMFIDIPCFSCIHMDNCYEGGYYEPKYCPWIKEWLEANIKK
uniref:MarR family transcriptional regulator n=1 Tax=Staphylothermus marinus TaxID=2280 RepID=A0A7C4JN85_STAMA